MSVADYCCFNESDELLHQPGSEPAWNESMAFCSIEPSGQALFIRHGRRYNEGHLEVTVAQHNPNGSLDVAFAKVPLERQSIGDGRGSTGGGLSFALLEPMKRWRATYSGKIRHIPRYQDFADNPGTTLKSGVAGQGSFDLIFEDRGPLFSTGPHGSIPGGAKYLSGRHYESSIFCKGEISVGGETRTISTYGFRDHSWGVRDMSRIAYTRWYWAQVDPRTSCVGWFTRDDDQQDHSAGIIIRDGVFEVATSATVASTYTPAPEGRARSARLQLGSPSGIIDLEIETGCPLPLRYARENRITRGLEFAARVKTTGLPAWAEYWDLMVEGRPAGNSVC